MCQGQLLLVTQDGENPWHKELFYFHCSFLSLWSFLRVSPGNASHGVPSSKEKELISLLLGFNHYTDFRRVGLGCISGGKCSP